MSALDAYKKAEGKLPECYYAWQIFGAGFENIGKNGRPVQLKLREPEQNEVLLRVDALGLCLSDIKIINLGSKHPRLRGRDLSVEPTVLGHEASVTVIKVGRAWKDAFRPGERYIVQADIYYQGVGYAFGYLIPGGLAQYCYLDERALAGDEGCYLLPVKPQTGYSQAALAEPWACVEMSYSLEDKTRLGPGRVLCVGEVSSGASSLDDCEVVHVPASIEGIPAGAFDDILIANPTPELVNALAPRLNAGGCMHLLGAPSEDGSVTLDIGRIHYENIRFYGGGPDLAAVQKANARRDLLPQGTALFIGAGGPMGQMHVQRAIELPCGSRRVVVTDLDRGRLDHIENRFGEMAKAKGVELHTLAPSQFDNQETMNARIRQLAPNGYNDLCVLAPISALVSNAILFAADGALVNVFAGIAIGNTADVPLSSLCRGIKIIGSSGSRIRDLRKVLNMVERRELNTNLSVAAIGGLNVARDGLEAVRDARFPGKTVIYPQIPDLPLMRLDEVPKRVPELSDKLGPQGAWTIEAEQALLERFL